jgi:hypothetical protein
MRILRIRYGFQADHSSSSYLFYAVDHAVSAKGQQIAHRYSSRADVDERTARYQKWGESELSSEAYKALLGEHYDVMASESYDLWTLMIAVPKTPQAVALLVPFRGLDDGEFRRLDVHDYGRRLVVELNCTFNEGGPWLDTDEDVFEDLTESLAQIRAEILQGDVSFLQAVAAFYCGGGEDEEGPDSEEETEEPPWESKDWSKIDLQEECAARGIDFRKSWTKDQLRAALGAAAPDAGKRVRWEMPRKLSRAARFIVDSLGHL